MFKDIYAHLDQGNRRHRQLLLTHLINVAEDCKGLAQPVQLSQSAYLVGLLHDIGKINHNFQRKICEDRALHVDHSSLGGYFIFKLFESESSRLLSQSKAYEQLFQSFKDWGTLYSELCDYANIIAYSIMSHHGPYDMVRKNRKNEYEYTTFSRLKKIQNEGGLDCHLLYEEVSAHMTAQGILLQELFYKGFLEYMVTIQKLRQLCDQSDDKEEALLFYKGMLIRLIVSILKSADIKDTINAFEPIAERQDKEAVQQLVREWEGCIDRRYAAFGQPTSPLNIIRRKIASTILQRSQQDSAGIYRLDLPTGAGKTLLSLRYGVNQMKYTGKQRFFYVTSYLSVLEQNAAEIKKVLRQSPYILEHHSNVINEDILPDDPAANDDLDDALLGVSKKFLLDDWTSPMILTTMVQFFNTLFKGHSSHLMRFKSFINSVVILDELQSLPTEMLYLTNLALNFMRTVMGTSIVLSTATQPTYHSNHLTHRLIYGDALGQNTNIITLSREELRVFDRASLCLYGDIGKEYPLADLYDLVCKHPDKSRLIILNTKGVVKGLYDLVEKDLPHEDLYYLTTNLTANDRLERLQVIKEKLSQSIPICVITTPLIEAGVDVDFDLVIRSLTGMDSIVQAMGRCNREGKRDKAATYVINLDSKEERIMPLKGMNERKSAGRYTLLQAKGKIPISALTDKYFEKLYANLDDCTLDPTLSLLASNSPSKELLFKSPGDASIQAVGDYLFYREGLILQLFQAFKRGYDNFQLIPDQQKTAIVASEDTEGYLDELRDLERTYKYGYGFKELKKVKAIIRKLSNDTVPVYDRDLENCESLFEGLVYILPEEFYSEDFGVQFDQGGFFKI
ncbi:CRISPR-associated helicase Cas3' [Peptococcus simiae]|uniref:CRISPR-associated helicase Cas3' n=1 Tax=Peptococcus simiae TaxID=1643805 RepID=UPI003980310D